MSILFLAVQAVRVINFPPTPRPDTASLDAARQSVTVGMVGDAVAIIAVTISIVVAVVSLRKVGEQTALANESLQKTIDQLKLSRASNDLVKQDLEFSRTQIDYLTREAKLVVSGHMGMPDVHAITIPNQKGRGRVYVRLNLENVGKKTARDATLLLWIPMEFHPVEDFDWHNPGEHFGKFGLKYVAGRRDENGKGYFHMAYDVPFPIYPKAPPRLLLDIELWAPVPTTDYILWRVTYDDGVTPPEDEQPGRLGITTIARGA